MCLDCMCLFSVATHLVLWTQSLSLACCSPMRLAGWPAPRICLSSLCWDYRSVKLLNMCPTDPTQPSGFPGKQCVNGPATCTSNRAKPKTGLDILMNLHFPQQESKTATGHLILEWHLQNCGPRDNFSLYKSIVSDICHGKGKLTKRPMALESDVPTFSPSTITGPLLSLRP